MRVVRRHRSERFAGSAFRAGPRVGFTAAYVVDTAAVSDSLTVSPGYHVSASANAASSLAYLRAASLADTGSASGVASSLLTAVTAVSSAAAGRDKAQPGIIALLTDLITAADAGGLSYALSSALAERMVGSSAVTQQITADQNLSDTVAAADAMLPGLIGLIQDAADCAAQALGVNRASVTVVSAGLIGSTLDLESVRQGFLADTAEASDSATNTLQAVQNLYDSIVFVVEVVTPDGERYVGWVYSPEAEAATELAGYNFFAFAQHPLGTLAANADGVYLLGGSTDDGAVIPWYLRTGRLALGSRTHKRAEALYVSGTSEGEITVKVTCSGGREGEQEATYTLDHVAEGVAENFRTAIGKGLAGSYWQFALSGETDADFSELMVRLARSKRRL